RDAAADIDLPPFANSAMDGFAVRAADTTGASAEAPRRLPVVGEVAAGDPGTTPLPTGAPVPPGADAVIPVEQTRATADTVDLLAAVAPGASVRPAGDDARRGQRV